MKIILAIVVVAFVGLWAVFYLSGDAPEGDGGDTAPESTSQ